MDDELSIANDDLDWVKTQRIIYSAKKSIFQYRMKKWKTLIVLKEYFEIEADFE